MVFDLALLRYILILDEDGVFLACERRGEIPAQRKGKRCITPVIEKVGSV